MPARFFPRRLDVAKEELPPVQIPDRGPAGLVCAAGFLIAARDPLPEEPLSEAWQICGTRRMVARLRDGKSVVPPAEWQDACHIFVRGHVHRAGKPVKLAPWRGLLELAEEARICFELDEVPEDRWGLLLRALEQEGIEVDAAELDAAPFEVEFDDRFVDLHERLRASQDPED